MNEFQVYELYIAVNLNILKSLDEISIKADEKTKIAD